MTAITELRSGTALSPVMLTNTTNSFSDGERPNVVGNPSLSNPTIAQWFNTAAFSTTFAPAQYYGTASRYSIPGPGTTNVNMSLSKTFQFKDTKSLEFRATANNAGYVDAPSRSLSRALVSLNCQPARSRRG